MRFPTLSGNIYIVPIFLLLAVVNVPASAEPPRVVGFVSVFGKYFFWGDYWIIGLGSDYDYAIVATPSRRWGWILSRDRQPPRQLIEGWLQQFRDQGYDPYAFVLTAQNSADSL